MFSNEKGKVYEKNSTVIIHIRIYNILPDTFRIIVHGTESGFGYSRSFSGEKTERDSYDRGRRGI